jgi:alpha-tubulin suppressor-like RCC1 family protein
MRRAIFVAGLAAIFGVVAVACGSSDDGGSPGANDDASAGDGSNASDTASGGDAAGTDGGGLDGATSDAPVDSGPPAVLPPGPTPIAAGWGFACAINGAGAIRCWGGARGEPVAMAAGSTFVDVAGTPFLPPRATSNVTPSTCAIRSDGALVCWAGWSTAPAVVGTGPYAKAMLAADGRPCAITKTGGLTCFTGSSLTETPVGADTDWALVAAGSATNYAVKTNGDIYAWTGTAAPVQVFAGTKVKDISASAAGNACFVEQDGALACLAAGAGGVAPKAIGTDKDWMRVATAYTSTCALKTNGTLWCLGSNAFGELAQPPSFSKTLPVQVGTDSDWTAVSVGYDNYACATKKDGSIRCWGSDGTGQLGRGTDHTKPTKLTGSYGNVSAGTDGACGATAAGAIACWGYRGDAFGAPALPTYVDTPTTIASATTMARAYAGWSSLHQDACAIATTTGTLYCWGLNEGGQAGTGAGSSVASPTSVGITVKSVALGFDHTCAVHADGSLYCWGSQSNGGPPAGSSTTPTKIGTDTWTTVSAGLQSTCGIKTDGTTWCWGSTYTAPMQQVAGAGVYTAVAWNVGGLGLYALSASGGVIAPGSLGFSGSYKSVAGGGGFACAIKNDGTLWCAGNDYDGQLGDGDVAITKLTAVQVGTATDWAEVSAGSEFACGRRTNGDVYCWGDDTSGQIGDGTAASAVPVLVH